MLYARLPRIYLPFLFTAHERRTCHTSGPGTVIPIAVVLCTIIDSSLPVAQAVLDILSTTEGT